MLLGRDRWRLAGAEITRILRDELLGRGMPAELDDLAILLGLTRQETEWRLAHRDPRWIRDLLARWNRSGGGLPRVLAVDHGDEVEFLITRPGIV